MQVQGITFMNTEWNRWRNLRRNRFVITWHKKVCSATLQSLRSFLFTVVSFETWQIYHFQPLQYLILPDKNICMTYSWINFYIFLVSKFQKVVILRSKNALNFCLEKYIENAISALLGDWVRIKTRIWASQRCRNTKRSIC